MRGFNPCKSVALKPFSSGGSCIEKSLPPHPQRVGACPNFRVELDSLSVSLSRSLALSLSRSLALSLSRSLALSLSRSLALSLSRSLALSLSRGRCILHDAAEQTWNASFGPAHPVNLSNGSRANVQELPRVALLRAQLLSFSGEWMLGGRCRVL